jgi:RNA polymerase sigma-70 factor (ECF subfamily)
VTVIEAGVETDQALVARARAGQRDAFGILVARHEAALVAFARRRLDADQARDAVQAAFTFALERLSDLRDPGAFKGWLFGVTLNECRRRQRGLRRFARALERWFDRRPAPTVRDDGQDDRQDVVRAAVARLPERQRLAVELRIWDGLSCEQAALALGCTTGTVKANFHHALTKLRRELERSS